MIDFHEKSKTNEKHGIKEVTDQIYIIKSLLSLVQSDHEHIKACSNTDNFDKELRLFNDILSMIDKKVKIILDLLNLYLAHKINWK